MIDFDARTRQGAGQRIKRGLALLAPLIGDVIAVVALFGGAYAFLIIAYGMGY